MLLEQAAESVCQRVGRAWLFGGGFVAVGQAAGSAAEHVAKVRREGGVGSGSTDVNGDAVFESPSGYVSYYAASSSAGDHAHELACDAACSCGCGSARTGSA